MLWKELQASINAMSDEELNKEVFVWGDEKPMSNVDFEVAIENMYFNNDYDDTCCIPASEADPDMLKSSETQLICEKGFKYLYS